MGFNLLDHGTNPYDRETAERINKTTPGMAHFAGTGPQGKTCRQCLNVITHGHYSQKGLHRGGAQTCRLPQVRPDDAARARPLRSRARSLQVFRGKPRAAQSLIGNNPMSKGELDTARLELAIARTPEQKCASVEKWGDEICTALEDEMLRESDGDFYE